MKILDRLGALMGRKPQPEQALTAQVELATTGGGGTLAPQTPPKVKPKQQTYPGHVTSTQPGDSALPKNDMNLANVDVVNTYRFGRDTSTVIRTLTKANPDFSGALAGHLRIGIPEKYAPFAYNPDGSFNVDATRLCMELLQRMYSNPGYDTGFTTVGSIRSCSEALAKEICIEGAMAMELVLNQQRQPAYFAPVPVSKLKFYDDFSKGTKTLKPVQDVGGEEIDLDIPNFFMVWLDPSLLDPYPEPPMQSAVQATLANSTFLNQLRQLCERHIFPRYHAKINLEKLTAMMTEEERADSTKQQEFYSARYAEVEAAINGLTVEQALISFDFLEVEFIKGQDGDTPSTFEVVRDIYNGKIATGAKTMPSILGHGSDNQNVASTETMVALLNSNGMVRLKLQEMYSKALTLSCLLMGMDVSVNFEFDEINLRPSDELEAFRAQKASRLREELSMGFITDEEYSLRMNWRLPRAGHVPLAGTMFHQPQPADPSGNNYSGTGVGGGQSGGGASNQARKSSAKSGKRGD